MEHNKIQIEKTDSDTQTKWGFPGSGPTPNVGVLREQLTHNVRRQQDAK